MKIAAKEHKLWHFYDPPQCDWAETLKEKESFVEIREVSSLDEVNDLCSMCRERRD